MKLYLHTHVRTLLVSQCCVRIRLMLDILFSRPTLSVPYIGMHVSSDAIDKRMTPPQI